MKLPIKRIKELNCPYCYQVVDGSQHQPMTACKCPHCGSEVFVPGVLGGYLVYQVIEKEPLSATFQAFDKTLERSVALRVLKPNLDETLLEAVMTSARRIAAISHPNIARVHRVEKLPGGENIPTVEFIENELLLGGKLEELIESQTSEPISELETFRILYDLLSGLKAVCEMGLCHLDITPRHIQFDFQGTPKLTHFADHRLLDKQRKLIGEPMYVAPEVALFATGRSDARAPDYRADLYSLGACFYHLLTKQPPFQGDDAVEIVKARFHQTPPALSEIRDIHPESESIILDLMTAKQDQRPSQMDAWLERLDEHLIYLTDQSASLTQQTITALNDLNQGISQSPVEDATDIGERTMSVALASVTAEKSAALSTKVLLPDGEKDDVVTEAVNSPWELEMGAATATGLYEHELLDLANQFKSQMGSQETALKTGSTATSQSRTSNMSGVPGVLERMRATRVFVCTVAAFTVSLFAFVVLSQYLSPPDTIVAGKMPDTNITQAHVDVRKLAEARETPRQAYTSALNTGFFQLMDVKRNVAFDDYRIMRHEVTLDETLFLTHSVGLVYRTGGMQVDHKPVTHVQFWINGHGQKLRKAPFSVFNRNLVGNRLKPGVYEIKARPYHINQQQRLAGPDNAITLHVKQKTVKQEALKQDFSKGQFQLLSALTGKPIEGYTRLKDGMSIPSGLIESQQAFLVFNLGDQNELESPVTSLKCLVNKNALDVSNGPFVMLGYNKDGSFKRWQPKRGLNLLQVRPQSGGKQAGPFISVRVRIRASESMTTYKQPDLEQEKAGHIALVDLKTMLPVPAVDEIADSMRVKIDLITSGEQTLIFFPSEKLAKQIKVLHVTAGGHRWKVSEKSFDLLGDDKVRRNLMRWSQPSCFLTVSMELNNGQILEKALERTIHFVR